MQSYLAIVNKVLKEGRKKINRTGVETIALPGACFEHDMNEGFPLLTTKRIPFRLISSELEFFIKGITDKNWLIERNNHIWDDWCRPDIIPYGIDEITKSRMKKENDLGPIYGWQWRNFGAEYTTFNEKPNIKGIDQLQNLVKKLKTSPDDRGMIVLAWNPVDLEKMALPPCHFSFQVTVISKRLNLLWNQRSVDIALGLPFNIASYGLLLHLLARDAELEPGKLVGFLGDTHIYTNHIDGLKNQMNREPFHLPQIQTIGPISIFEWEYVNSYVLDYNHHPSIKFEIAV